MGVGSGVYLDGRGDGGGPSLPSKGGLDRTSRAALVLPEEGGRFPLAGSRPGRIPAAGAHPPPMAVSEGQRLGIAPRAASGPAGRRIWRNIWSCRRVLPHLGLFLSSDRLARGRILESPSPRPSQDALWLARSRPSPRDRPSPSTSRRQCLACPRFHPIPACFGLCRDAYGRASVCPHHVAGKRHSSRQRLERCSLWPCEGYLKALLQGNHDDGLIHVSSQSIKLICLMPS
jgi:hypothetical protein